MDRCTATSEKADSPVLLLNANEPLIYDFHNPDSQQIVFSKELMGCLLLQFSKPMVDGNVGTAKLNGKPIYALVHSVEMFGREISWLGLKVGGYLHEYGMEAILEISGYRDRDGNEMRPVSVQLKTPDKVEPDPRYAAHDRIALQSAQDGIVLLKNEHNTLPLEQGSVLNFFGAGIHAFRLCAVGAGKINPRIAVDLLEAACEEENFTVNKELVSFYANGEDWIPDEQMLHRACALGNTAIMVISRPTGENMDNSSRKGEYYLTDQETSLMQVLRASFEKLVVILNVGYPIGVGFAEECGVDALVYSGFGGMYGGSALMNVLTGRVNPSGKLPDTWSVCYDSIPASRNFHDYAVTGQRPGGDDERWINTVYEEDIYVGYRYFETFQNADRRGFPFGHGLSYTEFSIQCDQCLINGDGLEISVQVCNTGKVPGREVVQLYISKPQGKLEQPARELVGFEKTKMLEPGECQKVTVTVPNSRMTSYDEELAAYVVVPGLYRVYLGGSIRDAKEIGSFFRESMQVLKHVKNRMVPNMLIRRLSQADPIGTYPTGEKSGILPGVDCLQPLRPVRETAALEMLPKTQRTVMFQDVLQDETLLSEYVGNMDVKTLVRISVCAGHGWGSGGRGEAGRLCRIDGMDLPEFSLADGNSGVNLRPRNVGMPSGVTLCASFDKELIGQVAQVIGEEAKELGIQMILAPAMNLHRNPLNGRHPEYFSEDPYLAGAMAGSFCRGLESTGVGGGYKHLLGNNAESSRKRNQSIISERAIREIYFRAFEYALQEYEPLSVMTAYNAVNGRHTSCDEELIQGMLFEECGFRGFVMTDWGSYDSADITQMPKAGNSWITPASDDDTYTKPIEDAVADGSLPLAQLQENVLRLIRALIKLNSKQSIEKDN